MGCEGSGTTFRGLRMRSRSTRKWAPRNAGDLGSRLAVCACAYDPIHVTAQGKRLGPNCACVQLPGSSLHKTMRTMQIQLLCMRVLYSMGSREQSCPYMGICDVTSVTWVKYSILIGREKICCALIGQSLKGPLPLLVEFFL